MAEKRLKFSISKALIVSGVTSATLSLAACEETITSNPAPVDMGMQQADQGADMSNPIVTNPGPVDMPADQSTDTDQGD